MPLVSVIMPIYNAEKYLPMAIDSICQQTLADWELILIDDGSSDDSRQICEMYQQKDKRIRAIHQKNAGICSARNKGLELARGEYVSFIDNDDVYLPDLLEENYRLAKFYKADILKYGNRYIKHKKFSIDDICVSGKLNEEKISVIKQAELGGCYREINDRDWLVYVWDGLFRRDWIQEQAVIFDTEFKAGHEDRVFCLQLYPEASCIVINPKIYYIHIVYKASTSRVFSAARIGDTERLLNYEHQAFDRLHLDTLHLDYWQERVMTYIILICSILRKPEAQISLQDMEQILQRLRERYYLADNSAPRNDANYKKRFKNRIYADLFENNHMNTLSKILIIDRCIKRVVQKFTTLFK
jgi:glycosyltransferase involved in cell wall biosynthesis